MTWKKFSEEKPREGSLIITKDRKSNYDEDGNEILSWEYNAGILKESRVGFYVDVACEEYKSFLKDNTEWQEVQE